MSLTRYTYPLSSYRQSARSLLEPFFDDSTWYQPRSTWVVDGNVAYVELNFAGYDKSEISVVLEDHVVRVLAESGRKKNSYSITLPQPSNPGTLTAKLDKGILTLEVGLENKSKKIEIQ
jgi:HSP20 family molecular chaperone IbpA